MLQTTLALYRNAYGGLPRTSWLLSLIMLINRSGSMVIPFMGVYLTQKLHFSLSEAGTIITIFGIGSIIGTYIGGWLTGKIGQYYVQFWSLMAGGFGFFVLMFMQTFWQISACIFIISIIVESLRPANVASVAQYSKAENLTRSYSLNRLAANLGYAIGPTLGGFLAAYDFRYLFLADGITCISAALFFRFWFKPTKIEKSKIIAPTQEDKSKSPYQDYPFLIAVGLTALCVITFFQMFTVMPLYFKQECFYSEQKIGFILSLNGLLVALFEMLIVYKLGEKVSQLKMAGYGTLILWLLRLLSVRKIYLLSFYQLLFLLWGKYLCSPI